MKCDDHSSLSSTTAVRYEYHIIHSITLCSQSCDILAYNTFLRHFESQKLWEKISCTSYIVSQISVDDVHINYFDRRQSPACLRSWHQLNFAGKPMLETIVNINYVETDYVSAIIVHKWRSTVPGRAGGCFPGRLAAYEKQGYKIQANFWLCGGLSLTSRDVRM